MLAQSGGVPTLLAGTPFLLEATSSSWPCFRTFQVKVRPAGILRLSCFLSVSVVLTWGCLPREGWPISSRRKLAPFDILFCPQLSYIQTYSSSSP